MSMHVVRVLMEILDNQTMQHVETLLARTGSGVTSLGHPGGAVIQAASQGPDGDPCHALLHAFRFMRLGGNSETEMVPHACRYVVRKVSA